MPEHQSGLGTLDGFTYYVIKAILERFTLCCISVDSGSNSYRTPISVNHYKNTNVR